MSMQCPGRKGRALDSCLVRCPECGAVVEMFSDEPKARCRCGQVILREEVPSCISWCAAAERCLGEVIDLRDVRKRVEEMQRKAKESGYVERVRKQIDESRRTAHKGKGGGRGKK